MAMTLRPTPDQAAVLKAAAEREGMSTHAFILSAALDRASDRTRRRDELIGQIRTDRRDLLDRLGKA